MIENSAPVMSTNLPAVRSASSVSPTVASPSTSRSQEEENCPICLSALDPEQGNLTHLVPCSHTYHTVCIGRWVNKIEPQVDCPTCRFPISLRQRLLFIKALKEQTTEPDVQSNRMEMGSAETGNMATSNMATNRTPPVESENRTEAQQEDEPDIQHSTRTNVLAAIELNKVIGIASRCFLRSVVSAGVGALGSLALRSQSHTHNGPGAVALASFLGSGLTAWLPELRKQNKIDFMYILLGLCSRTVNPALGCLLMAQLDAKKLYTSVLAGGLGVFTTIGFIVFLDALIDGKFFLSNRSGDHNVEIGTIEDYTSVRLDGFYHGVEIGLRLSEEAVFSEPPSHQLSESLLNELLALALPGNNTEENRQRYEAEFLQGFQRGLDSGYNEGLYGTFPTDTFPSDPTDETQQVTSTSSATSHASTSGSS